MRVFGFRFGLLAAGLLSATLFSGCKPSVESTASADESSSSSADEQAAAAEPSTDVAEKVEAKIEEIAESSEIVPIDAPPTGETVILGDPSLTAGIPGEGELTAEQLQAWLDDPKNHAALDIELPLGLAAGKAEIKGLDTSPMTRAKIELGRQLFFDTRLSADGKISCASCHDPDHGYAFGSQFGIGIADQVGDRNSPPAFNRIFSSVQFWDGRAQTLEEQAKGPIENPIEMGNEHDVCVETLNGVEGYKLQFDKIFPGKGLNIDTVAEAIASFERAIVTGPAPFDYYESLRPFMDMDETDLAELQEEDPQTFERYAMLTEQAAQHPMSDSAKRGRDLFFSVKTNCSACHVGVNFSDEKYHNLGVGMDKEKPDLGRYVVTNEDADRGAFKTPTLRNIALTPPYMHDGSQETLMEVVEWYAQGGHPNEWLSKDIRKLELTDQEKEDLVAFMQSLTSDFPPVERGRLPVN